MGIFCFWTFALIIISIISHIHIQQLENVNKNMYYRSIRLVAASIEAKLNLIKAEKELMSIILTEDQTAFTRQLNESDTLYNIVEDKLNAIQVNILAEDKLMQGYHSDAEEKIQSWKDIRDEVLELHSNSGMKSALEYLKNNSDGIVRDACESLDKLAEKERQSIDENNKKINDIRLRQDILVIFIVVFVLLSILIFMIYSDGVKKSIALLQDAMNASANTGELHEVHLRGRNEFVEMAQYYNILVKKLKKLFWLKDGQNLLNQELSGKGTLSHLTDTTITFLARFLEAGNGVLYLYNKEEGCLYLNSSFAMPKLENLPTKYKLGQGIIGQVAIERKPILLKNIKKGQSAISTGTGNMTPFNTYTFPLVYEGEIYGVVELASFEPFTPLKLEFLDYASSIISTSLYSAIQSQKVKILLEISENSQKELSYKANELKAANESLEQQKVLLQRQSEELQQTNVQLEEQQLLLQQQSEELQQTNVQLEEQQQQLEEQSRLINLRNEDLEQSRQELLKRSQELEQLNKYKSQFLANMSHELRTPLNSVILLSRLLKRNKSSELTFSKNDMEKIDVIYNSGQELLRLINDILDLSKVESGKMTLSITNFNSGELVDWVRQLFKSISKEKNLDFKVDDRVNKKLKGDRGKISQILGNFLSNSFKFTEAGSISLLITEREENGEVLFTVSDTGIGIKEEELGIIFDEFSQGDGSISRKYGGTGLGLSISKKLAELMGGRIEVKSELGKGSTFTLIMPDLLDDTSIVYVKGKDDENPRKNRKVILVVEPEFSFSNYIADIVQNMGFDGIMAETGEDALEVLNNKRVDGILLDLRLPDMSGINILRELKSTEELRKIPVHIISKDEKDNSTKEDVLEKGYNSEKDDDFSQLIKRVAMFSDKCQGRLLIVEDDVIQRQALKELIQSGEVSIKAVDNEERARFEINKDIYDLVIVDLTLKQGDGMEICKYICEQGLNLPVIIYTGRELSVHEEKELSKYADRIIIKTANSEQRLLDEVTLFLNKVKKDDDQGFYLLSKMKEECALSLEKKKILIVDDDPRNLFVLASALEDYGAEIIDAENGKIAIDILNENQVDLVLMDIMMPVMDGYEAISEIRKSEKLKNIPVIALTAKSLKGDKEKCIKAGANDYISKPVDFDVLIRLVKAWIIK